MQTYFFKLLNIYNFFYGGRDLNLVHCIYYTLSLSTEVSSRGQCKFAHVRKTLIKRDFFLK